MLWILLACSSPSPPPPQVVERPPVEAPPPPSPATTEALLEGLRHPESAPDALDELVARQAVAELEQVALEDPDLGARGWAIVGLEELEAGRETLIAIQLDRDNPELLRVWAAAARVPGASPAELEELRVLSRSWPELERPLKQRGVL